jgi:nicotinamidase-related amidase
VTEQYPKGLEGTVKPLKELLPPDQTYFSKTVFSSWADDTIRRHIESLSKKQWILIGIEAHVCVQQTAMDMLEAGFEVVVVNDAISSRSIYDFSTGIADMRDQGVRISSAEAVLFEIIKDSKHPQFKEFSKLIK